MPKVETKELQSSIVEFGKKLGFDSKIEERCHGRNAYSPVYDVVWYLNLEKIFNFSKIKELFKNDLPLFDKIKNLPFAGFEIEGANTSSKNQISNFANLYCGDFVFNFVVVNNSGANNEEDTYRRGIKINHYFIKNSGDRNTIFMDAIHFRESMEKLDNFDNSIDVSNEVISREKGTGGEDKSLLVYDKIKELINGTGLKTKKDFSPSKQEDKIRFMMLKEAYSQSDSMFARLFSRQGYYNDPYASDIKIAKKEGDAFYIPKLDIVLGFDAPKGFASWMKIIANTLKEDCAHYPTLYGLKKEIINSLFISLISIEIETSINKHLNGGIYNMSKNSFAGILVTEENAQMHIEFFKKEIGIKNVTSYWLN
jgi:hypothetical protein